MFYNVAGLGLGISALSFSLTPESKLSLWIKRLAPLGKLSFGIYLAHILFLGPMRSVAARYGWNTTLSFATVATLFAVLASMLLTLGLLRIRWLRWLVK